jgi:hypothetical protein
VGSTVPHIIEDGAGGAIVAWEDVYERARALRIAPDGPVSVGVSLVSAIAELDHVTLTWFTTNAASHFANVERRTPTSDWSPLGTAQATAADQLQYEDRAITPGGRYAYRLRYYEDSQERFTAETWLDVPKPVFALYGLRPNPAVGECNVAFSLAEAVPATLELYDVTGRKVMTREVGGNAGMHRLRLDEGVHLRAGVYTLRLVQSGEWLTTRAVVIR